MAQLDRLCYTYIKSDRPSVGRLATSIERTSWNMGIELKSTHLLV